MYILNRLGKLKCSLLFDHLLYCINSTVYSPISKILFYRYYVFQ